MAKLIAIEGIDGSGKHTQSKLLVQNLKQMGFRVSLFCFPDYAGTFFGREIGALLNGRYGELNDVHPNLIATLFAGDRFEKSQEINALLNDGVNVICDRYIASNFAHQGARLTDLTLLHFKAWLEELEFNVLKSPKPDLNVLLDLPADVSNMLLTRKEARDYTNRSKDIYENQRSYQEKVYDTYKQLAQQDDWLTIECFADERLRQVDAISQELTKKIAAYLRD